MTFTITQNQNQYLTYCLKDEEADAYLEVVPARGGIITRWQICGEDIFGRKQEYHKCRSWSAVFGRYFFAFGFALFLFQCSNAFLGPLI